MDTQRGLDAALKSIAAEMDLAHNWHRISRSLEQVRFATIFGSARTLRGEPAYEMARELGTELAERGWAVVTGGGPGIMQAARDGCGIARSRSVRIEIAGEEPETVLDRSRTITVATFALRKLLLIQDVDALFVFPGGVGTFDELFEVLVQQDTDRLRQMPVILVEPDGGKFWEAWLNFMDEHLISSGLASRSVLNSVMVARSVGEALTAAEQTTDRLASPCDRTH